MSEDIKSFLYAWLGKNKVQPEYNIRPTGRLWFFKVNLEIGK